MKRNIVANIIFTKNKIRLVILEKLASSRVEIFSAEDKTENYFEFLETAMLKVKTIIGGSLKSVSVVIQPFSGVNEKIFMSEETMSIPNNIISHQDIENIVEITRNKYTDDDNVVVGIQPIKFDVIDVTTKSYSIAPRGKSGDKLSTTFAITTIDRGVYKMIYQITKSHNLSIVQILLACQATSYNNLSDNAQFKGAGLIHIDDTNIYMTMVKNYAVVNYFKIPNVGKSALSKIIGKEFNIDYQEVESVLLSYADFTNGEDERIINMKNFGSTEMKNCGELNIYIKELLGKVFMAFKIELTKILGGSIPENYPIVFSGSFTNIDNFDSLINEIFELKNTLVYKPMTFIEVNRGNHETLGMIQYMNKSDEIMGMQFDTIVETNGNIGWGNKNSESQSFIGKVKHWIGEKYGWR